MIKAFCKWYLTAFHNVAKFKQKKKLAELVPIESIWRGDLTPVVYPANWDRSADNLQTQITELQKENASQKKELLLSRVKKGVTVKVNDSGAAWFSSGRSAGVKVGEVDNVYSDGESVTVSIRFGNNVEAYDLSRVTPLVEVS